MNLLGPFEQWLPLLKLGVYGGVALAALMGLASVVYVVRSTVGPLLRLVQWLCWHTPGTPPTPLVAGIVHGLRLVVWSGLIAVFGWFLWSFS